MSRRRKRGGKLKFVLLGLLAVVVVGLGYGWTRLQPMPRGRQFYVRYEEPQTLTSVLQKLQDKGTIRDARMAGIALRLLGVPPTLRRGTYAFRAGDGIRTLAKTVESPLRRMVRLRQMRWISRTGAQLQKEAVCTRATYIAATKDVAPYRAAFPFLPARGSLEGYLMPDTYDLPPLLPAQQVVAMQLESFSRKVAPLLKGVEDPNRVLTAASLVEMEASDPQDRRMIAGIIENRLKKRMRLQIDATVNYGRQRWGRLYYRDYTGVKSPYNTYLVEGLPPGPICTPSADSVEAVLKPAKHPHIYYVAMPDGKTVYAPNYEEHLENVALRRRRIAAGEGQ